MRFILLAVFSICLFFPSMAAFSQALASSQESDLSSAQTSAAEEKVSEESSSTENKANDAFIIDDLFIFMRSGPGPQYRLLGSITSGTRINLSGEAKNGFQKITDDKNREGWVEQQYITTKPGLRISLTDLKIELDNKNNSIEEFTATVDENQQQIESLTANNSQLKSQLASLTKQLATSEAKNQQRESGVQKQWFFNGAIVLGIGLFLGLLLPKFFARRRNSMESWQ